ncbi:Alpha/Beta hydrolase protein [Chlamydoabsidia padenii]|nr:Alpha/Beta hydrolase protein [Chlamydoabsidia padenii]
MKLWIFPIFGTTLLSLLTLVTTQQAGDYKVTSLPGVNVGRLPFDQYAGHIEVSSETDGNLFFWMLEQVKPTQPKKLIIWLNGGPGCSSMDGLFLENGPYRVNPDLSLTVSTNGWQEYATMVFLDQPVGTGFSFANGDSLMHNMTQIAQEFTTFMDKFMDVFPHLKEQDLYLAGESFAGTYIPYFANRMLALNQEEPNKYNLKGVAIGNGWISPKHQYDAYYDFGMKHGLIIGDYLEKTSTRLKKCREKLSMEPRINLNVCEDLVQDILQSSAHMDGKNITCINSYDIRIKNESYPGCGLTWPHELVDVRKYLRLNELTLGIHSQKQALGWQECARPVQSALQGDPSPPADMLLPGLLKEIKVLLFSGEYDFMCNHLGTEYMIGNMTWNGDKGFKDAERQEWTIGDKTVGYYTEERNLSYVLVKDSSHMVPYDKPVESLDMINRFIGVGGNKVNGITSNVGDEDNDDEDDDDDKEEEEEEEEESTLPDQPVIENESLESPMDIGHNDDDKAAIPSPVENPPSPAINPSHSTDSPSSSADTSSPSEDKQDSLLGHYAKNAGSYGGALVILVLFVAIGGCCYRYKTHHGRPWTSLWHQFKDKLGSRSGYQRPKFRLDEQEETNEL